GLPLQPVPAEDHPRSGTEGARPGTAAKESLFVYAAAGRPLPDAGTGSCFQPAGGGEVLRARCGGAAGIRGPAGAPRALHRTAPHGAAAGSLVPPAARSAAAASNRPPLHGP